VISCQRAETETLQFDHEAIFVFFATVSGAAALVIKSLAAKVLDARIEKYKPSLAQETEQQKLVGRRLARTLLGTPWSLDGGSDGKLANR
jgi:hypothetical protein